jgi:hypothetical protein
MRSALSLRIRSAVEMSAGSMSGVIPQNLAEGMNTSGFRNSGIPAGMAASDSSHPEKTVSRFSFIPNLSAISFLFIGVWNIANKIVYSRGN